MDVTYKFKSKDGEEVLVTLDSNLTRRDDAGKGVDYDLPPSVAGVFTDALDDAGIFLTSKKLRAYVESMPNPQPWPVFVYSGSDVFADFWPVSVEGA